MLNNKLFISSIPPVLSKDELYDYIKKAHNGDLEARKTVVEHNIGIVLYHVSKKFATAPYDLKELASVGLIGLIKSVDNFNFEKNTNFNTYALNCINNEILMFIKRNKRTLNNMSLDDKLKNKKSNDEFIIGDVLENKSSDFVLDYETQEVYKTIRKVVKSLPYKDNRIITYYFGFENNKRYTQNEIAEKLGISQPTVSILLKNILKKIKSELIKLDIIEKNKPTIVKKMWKNIRLEKRKAFMIISIIIKKKKLIKLF